MRKTILSFYTHKVIFQQQAYLVHREIKNQRKNLYIQPSKKNQNISLLTQLNAIQKN